jgi:hypothetical protein
MAVNGRAGLQTRQLYHRADAACPGVRANGLGMSSGMGINLGDNLSAFRRSECTQTAFASYHCYVRAVDAAYC